eukprot:gi/632939197/ref/XP_007908141.1/ PREDICTED: RCC1 domain-containing protein 1 [Callorhinchus milii]
MAVSSSRCRCFGFGFNQFGQIEREEKRAAAPGPAPAPPPLPQPSQPEAQSLGEASQTPPSHPRQGPGETQRPGTRICPTWGRTAWLTDDGSVFFYGFVAGRPWQQLCVNNQDNQHCKDILCSEKYLLVLYEDKVECWDVRELCSAGGTDAKVTWTMQLKEREAMSTVLPLVPGGYITTVPPFYKSLSPLLNVVKLVLGTEHALLLSMGGTVYSWGSGHYGQLGHGSVENEVEPRIVEALHGLVMAEIAAGAWHSVSASESGDLYLWGWNESGQLGLPTKSCCKNKGQLKKCSEEGTLILRNPSDMLVKSASEEVTATQEPENVNVFISIQAFPALVDLPDGSEVRRISCGSRHTAAINRGGELFTWGWCNYGQLGHGHTDSSDQPKRVEYFVKNQLTVLDVACGPWNTFVFAEQKEF